MCQSESVKGRKEKTLTKQLHLLMESNTCHKFYFDMKPSKDDEGIQ